MKKDILDAINEACRNLSEEKTQAIMRSVNVIDYLHETASRIAFFFIATRPCEQARALSHHPEALAIQAMQAALRQVANGGRQHGDPVH